MWADMITKEMDMHKGMEELLTWGNLLMKNEGINRVKCLDGEIRMENIRNPTREKKQSKFIHINLKDVSCMYIFVKRLRRIREYVYKI